MDPVGYSHDRSLESEAIAGLRRKIRAVFEWVKGERDDDSRGTFSRLDPEMGTFLREEKCPGDTHEKWNSCWMPLGVRRSPIILLSSLAPGVDTIAAEEALNIGITVRAPLPFPLAQYKQCSTFNPSNRSHEQAAMLARLDELISKIRAQEGFLEERDIFEVGLQNYQDDGANADPATEDATGATGDLTAADPATGKPRRHLRYRAAGEYIASYCHILLAVYDPRDEADPDDPFDCGSVAIVETMRRGVSWGLLAAANNFSWTDNGPVVRLSIERLKHRALGPLDAKRQTFAVLHPYDARPEDCDGCPDDDPKWLQQGDRTFRRVVGLMEEFNAEPARRLEEDREWLTMLADPVVRGPDGKAVLGNDGQPQEKDNATLVSDLKRLLTGAGFAFAEVLAPIAAIRRRAASIANVLDGDRQRLLRWLLSLVAIAALCIAAFEHWHSRRPHTPGSERPWLVHDVEGAVQTGLVFLGLFALVVSGVAYHRHLKRQAERRRHDARGIAEGLRVQFYWSLAGLGQSVPANYMQRQSSELSWIRFVIASVSFPYERSRRGFEALPASVRHALLSVVHERWVRDQRAYYERKAQNLARQLHSCHRFGWSFAAAGVLNVVTMFVLVFSPRLRSEFEDHIYLPSIALGTLGFSCLLIGWLRSRSNSASGHSSAKIPEDEEVDVPSGFLHWLFRRLHTWGYGCLYAAIVLPLPPLLALLPDEWPESMDWWTILTELLLLMGGLWLAWAERNFLSELSRQYRAMRHLFAAADRRLKTLLDRLNKQGEATPCAARIHGEISDILYNLGREAQDENAEWLMLHRARPLEPFMAG